MKLIKSKRLVEDREQAEELEKMGLDSTGLEKEVIDTYLLVNDVGEIYGYLYETTSLATNDSLLCIYYNGGYTEILETVDSFKEKFGMV